MIGEQNSADLVEEEKPCDNEVRAMFSKAGGFKLCFMTVGGRGSEGCLIYIAMSKAKGESISHLRKQLQIIHCLLMSAGTKSMINGLKQNSNYDILNCQQVREQIP